MVVIRMSSVWCLHVNLCPWSASFATPSLWHCAVVARLQIPTSQTCGPSTGQRGFPSLNMIINDNYYTINKDCFTLCIYIYIYTFTYTCSISTVLGCHKPTNTTGTGKKATAGQMAQRDCQSATPGIGCREAQGIKTYDLWGWTSRNFPAYPSYFAVNYRGFYGVLIS